MHNFACLGPGVSFHSFAYWQELNNPFINWPITINILLMNSVETSVQ